MIRNYLLLAYRNLIRHKNYTLFNLAGLTIGIACSLMIFLLIRYEYSFDRYHTKKDRIYRVVTERNLSSGTDYDMGTPFPMAQTLRASVPQLDNASAIFGNIINGTQIDVLDENRQKTPKRFNEVEGVSFVEPNFFQILDFKWLAGDPLTALKEPKTVVLIQSIAEKYFGDWKLALGRFVQLGNRDILTVTGVLQDPPSNSDFPLKVVVSYKTFGNDLPDWESGNSNQQCYVLLHDSRDVAKVTGALAEIAAKYKKAPNTDRYLLQPLGAIHFDSRYSNYNRRTVSTGLVKALSVIGLFLIIIACINFVNLATAQVLDRAKEAGIRKVLGGLRSQLMFQWIAEAFVLVFISILLSILVTYFVLPFLNEVIKLPLKLSLYEDPQLILFLAGLMVFVALSSSLYPAYLLSGFKPVEAIKSKISLRKSKLPLRKALVVFQFLIAQLLIIGTIVILTQTKYFRNAPLGFDKETVITVPMRTDSIGSSGTEALRQRLLARADIRHVSFAITSPAAQRPNWWTGFKFRSTKDAGFDLNLKFADTAYFETYKLKLLAGRVYQASDTVREAVVNETLLKKLNIKNPEDAIGEELVFWDKRVPIVGVVKDFHISSLRDEIVPVMLTTNKTAYWRMSVQMDPTNIDKTLAGIEKSFTSIYPENIFEYQFVDAVVASFYEQEKKLSKLFQLFSIVGIVICCLGLYGLVSFMAVRKTKEIGIRKVLGASVAGVASAFAKEYLALVLLAFVVAVPVGWYFMNHWLQNFAYRMTLGWWVFGIALALVIVISLLTVGFRTLKAAGANPVESLRTE